MVILIYVTLSVIIIDVNLMNVVAPFGPTKKDGLFDFVGGSIENLLGLSYKIFYDHNLYRGVAGMNDPN